ncbi:helix-turn-helix domain-containing protein [Qipengyuania marisflavi]|uniref:Helix-turn-helix domain-containing protein n=1 Tax=Qipengyuania marisflavi TaxID=2486356 RepID=A0A5S3PBS3_9SPHN|nr:helix-turn-helix domain-containing protein [Qipengyuania marisflavi]TMM48679.1 helix-turn-helix domain-containing protein [Qipengyuania marisflavi]
MSFHRPILPGKAIQLVKSRNLDAPEKLLADYAAAGLIKTYALMREIRPAGGPTKTVRDSQIPQEEWGRIVASDNIVTALNGGTVQLEGSKLPGGPPTIRITGISFSEASLTKVLDRYCTDAPSIILQEPLARISEPQVGRSSAIPSQSSKHRRKEVAPIKPGDLTATVAQAVQATGLGRTKIDQLMRDGTLERTKVGRRTLISVESIERLAGTRVAR